MAFIGACSWVCKNPDERANNSDASGFSRNQLPPECRKKNEKENEWEHRHFLGAAKAKQVGVPASGAASSQQNVESVDRTLLSESNHLQAGDENCLYDQSNRSYARMEQA